MELFLNDFLKMTRKSFSREAAYNWFVIVFIGLMFRNDTLGVSSIIRALDLCPRSYECLLHFFHASSWNGSNLLLRCVGWLDKNEFIIKRNGKIVINGDETKTPKEGRKMPWVGTIRQTSETSSKPSYFRGHEWGMLGVLMGVGDRMFCAPAWASLMEPGVSVDKSPRTTGIVNAASELASSLGFNAYLVLDAFYAAGTVFKAAMSAGNITIITRAKSNCTAHVLAKPVTGKKGRGRPRIYERVMKITKLFDSESDHFKTHKAKIYGRSENVSIYTITLFWKPAGALLLFVLAKTSRGTITLMCSDITTNPVDVLELYCSRSLIEVMFDRLKNLLGIMHYHFWSKSISPQSRRPGKNKTPQPTTKAIQKKKEAISNFVHIGLVLLLFLQAFACKFGEEASSIANCWLRTPSKSIPSEFIAKVALRNFIGTFLTSSASNPITKIIKMKKRRLLLRNVSKKAA
jgi:hypothetical protein